MKMKCCIGVAVLLAACVAACGRNEEKSDGEAQVSEYTWDFDNAEGWVYFHQDTATVDQWKLDDGKLALTTRAGTYDRTKMHTADADFAEGEYRWRTFIPAVATGDQTSIGSWIYSDDHHELDFEVGSGTAEIRERLKAAPGDMVACMTCQDFPFKSDYALITPGWHDFQIDLTVEPDGNYLAVWSIDGKKTQSLKLRFGPEVGFSIHCSVENLKFIGDHIATQNYTGLFDRVSFRGKKK